ncbi:hypothetical protein NL676_028620 [Syzygium grande]|nr:hypothetical protein NL676_028620 [Syzygium grande]
MTVDKTNKSRKDRRERRDKCDCAPQFKRSNNFGRGVFAPCRSCHPCTSSTAYLSLAYHHFSLSLLGSSRAGRQQSEQEKLERSKVVLITGASTGTGEYLAYEYARRGARLALVVSESEIKKRSFLYCLNSLPPNRFGKAMGHLWTVLTHAHSLAGPVLILLYPLYASVMAIESTSKGEDEQWLAYWILYSFLTLVEMLFRSLLEWVPVWYDVKLILVAWLVLPQFKGAAFLYKKLFVDFITPKKGEQEAY